MPIVTAGDLATWAATLAPETLVVIGDAEDYENDDSNVRTVALDRVVHHEYLYRWRDDPEMGWVNDNPEHERYFCEEVGCPGCEQGIHVWHGIPVWRLGL